MQPIEIRRINSLPRRQNLPFLKDVSCDFAVFGFKVLNKKTLSSTLGEIQSFEASIRWLHQVGFVAVSSFERTGTSNKDLKSGGNFCIKAHDTLLLRVQVLLDPTLPNPTDPSPIGCRCKLVCAAGKMVLEAAKAQGLIDFKKMVLLHEAQSFENLKEEWFSKGFWSWKHNFESLASYYGSKVSFYFAWVRFYSMALLLPAGVGVLLWEPKNPDPVYLPVFVAFLAIWNISFLDSWRRASAVLAYEWGVSNSEEENKWLVLATHTNALCSLFFPEESKTNTGSSEGFSTLQELLTSTAAEKQKAVQKEMPVAEKRKNPVGIDKVYIEVIHEAEKELEVNDWKYNCILVFSYTVQLTLLAFSISVLCYLCNLAVKTSKFQDPNFWLVRAFPSFFAAFPPEYLHYLAVGLQSVVALVLAVVNQDVAYWLNRLESTPDTTSEEFESALILKLFGFQFVNYYCGLFYVAFWEQDMLKLQSFLFSGLVFREFLNVIKEVVLPYLLPNLSRKVLRNTYEVHFIDGQAAPERSRLLKKQLDDQLNEPEFLLGPVEFLSLVIQFGYVVMFSAAYPLAPLLALVGNTFEFRVDLFNLIYRMRRPDFVNTRGIGPWQNIMQFMGLVGILSNCGIVLLTSNQLDKWMAYFFESYKNYSKHMDPFAVKVIVVILLEHILLFTWLFVAVAIPDVPKATQKQLDIQKLKDTVEKRLVNFHKLRISFNCGSF